MRNRYSLLIGLLLLAATGWAAVPPPAALPFVANRGQWARPVRFAATVPGGWLFLENNAFTYNLRAAVPACGPAEEAAPARPGHAFRVTLVGARPAPELRGEGRQTTYHNYFLGNDPARWAGRVPLFSGVRYGGVYPGVDLRWHQRGPAGLEYDFEVAPGGRPAAIRLHYDGLDGLAITPEGHLQLRTGVGELREQAPVAWQTTAAGLRRPVPCRFVLRGHEVSFALGAAYNPAEPLVIDPVLVFCTYSGSPGGMSANATAADAQGNLFSAGYTFGPQYPVTLGAYKTSYTRNNIGISKIAPRGTGLVYATYLGSFGGGGNAPSDEYPLDLAVNAAGELLLLGTTTSVDYPTTAGAFSRALNGAGGFNRDYVVTHFNAAGTALMASTYLGGSGEESGSVSSIPASLALDPGGDVLVAGATTSLNYPVLNALQPTPGGGGRDGVLSRLSPNLGTLRWSTYLGGRAEDQALDVRVAPNGEVYACGLTRSANFPVGPGGLLPTGVSNGFNTDGFVLRLSAAGVRLGGTFLSSTNSNSSDVARFLDFDADGRVLVGGATDGPYPLTPGVFSTPTTGTSVFVHGLSPDLKTTTFSTQVGVASFGLLSSCNVITAFGRDDCGRLYFSAYTGAQTGTSCPRTPDALSQTPRALYVCALGENGVGLLYGSFLGNATNNVGFGATHLHFAASNVVSRSGVLYHIVCTTSPQFGTTPGVFAPALLTGGNYDGAACKFDLGGALSGGGLQAVAAPVPPGCAPYAVQFDNQSAGPAGVTYQWDFGDGSPADAAPAPRHTYLLPGAYAVRLRSTRPPGAFCGSGVSEITLTVTVLARPLPGLAPVNVLCPGGSVALTAADGPGYTYRWSTGATTRSIAATAPGRYRVLVSNGACATADSALVRTPPSPQLVADTAACTNGSLELRVHAEAGSTFRWSTGQTTDRISVPASGLYSVQVVSSGCPFERRAQVTLRRVPLHPNVITPNNDGLNETFVPTPLVSGTRVRLFNRWGGLAYSSDNYQNDWGAGQAPGIYYYVVENEKFCERLLKGWVEVIR